MGIENLSENIILVTLPEEPQFGDELETINEIISNKSDCDVVIDFTIVEMLTSASICNLMILRKLLSGLGHQLILCNVSFPTKCIFTLTGLETFFEFTDDKFAALAALKHANQPSKQL